MDYSTKKKAYNTTYCENHREYILYIETKQMPITKSIKIKSD